MRAVVDASTVVAYLLGEGSDAERESMLDDVHAPALVDVEAMQALRGLVRGAKLDLDRAETARDDLRRLRLRRSPDAPLLRRAWELRDRCATYDALYVALAEALDVALLTRDARLADAAGTVVDVRVTG